MAECHRRLIDTAAATGRVALSRASFSTEKKRLGAMSACGRWQFFKESLIEKSAVFLPEPRLLFSRPHGSVCFVRSDFRNAKPMQTENE
jgi:hypothetical protein